MNWGSQLTDVLVGYTNGSSLFVVDWNSLSVNSTLPKVGSVLRTVTHLSTAWHYAFKHRGSSLAVVLCGTIVMSISKDHTVISPSVSEDWKGPSVNWLECYMRIPRSSQILKKEFRI